MNTLKLSVAAGAVLAGAVFSTGPAAALPIAGLAPTVTDQTAAVQDVRWVCGPYRCWWRPNFYGYRAYGWARPGWGWHRGWHRW